MNSGFNQKNPSSSSVYPCFQSSLGFCLDSNLSRNNLFFIPRLFLEIFSLHRKMEILMKTPRISNHSETVLNSSSLSFSFHRIIRQAWGLFIFSSIFAVLFNAFYSDGIELKFKPPSKTGFQPSTPISILGFNSTSLQATLRITPTPISADSDNIIRLSLSGAKDRFDKKNCVFLDARKPEEYIEGHISGALNFYGNELDRFAPGRYAPNSGQEKGNNCLLPRGRLQSFPIGS